MRNVRLALLLCDEIIMESPEIMAKFGEYTKMFHRFLTSSLGLITSDVTFTLDGYVVYNMEYPPDDAHYDAILISGSRRAPPTDPIPWVEKLIAYVKHTITAKPSVKVFGICFGHQIVALALGGWVETREWEVSVTNTRLTCIGRAIFRTHELNLQLFHQREVTKSPPHAHLLGSSEAVHSQGMVIFDPASVPLPADFDPDALCVDLTSIHVLTLQGHPELTEPVMRMLIIKSADQLPSGLVDDALSRVGLPTDAIDKVGRVLWGMLGVTSER